MDHEDLLNLANGSSLEQEEKEFWAGVIPRLTVEQAKAMKACLTNLGDADDMISGEYRLAA